MNGGLIESLAKLWQSIAASGVLEEGLHHTHLAMNPDDLATLLRLGPQADPAHPVVFGVSVSPDPGLARGAVRVSIDRTFDLNLEQWL